MKRLQIMIDEDVDRALGEQAGRDHTSKAALVRRYVDIALRPVPPLEGDPLSRFIGAADFEPADVDELLYGS